MKSEKCRKSSGRIIKTFKNFMRMNKPQEQITPCNNAPAKGGKSITNLNFCVMKNLFKLSMALFIGAAMFSCQQAEEPTMDQGQAPETRAFGDTPVVAIYVETNDTNPLNAGDYTMSNGKPFAGIVGNSSHRTSVNVRSTVWSSRPSTSMTR